MPDSISRHAVLFGGAGFIGTELIKALSADHWHITVVTKRPHRHRNLLVIPNLKMVAANQLSESAIEALIGESDTVVNLIGILNQSQAETFAELQTHLPERSARVALRNKARRLVNFSGLGAAVDAPSQYLKSRGRGEQEVLSIAQLGLPVPLFGLPSFLAAQTPSRASFNNCCPWHPFGSLWLRMMHACSQCTSRMLSNA